MMIMVMVMAVMMAMTMAIGPTFALTDPLASCVCMR